MYAYYQDDRATVQGMEGDESDDEIPPPPAPLNDWDEEGISILELAEANIYDESLGGDETCQSLDYTYYSGIAVNQFDIASTNVYKGPKRSQRCQTPQLTQSKSSHDSSSNSIFQSYTNQGSPTDTVKVEDRLNEYGKLTQKKREQRLKEKETTAKNESKLHLIASHPVPEGYDHIHVVDRLTNYSLNRPNDSQLTKKESLNQRDILTGQKLFEPMINKTSEKIAARSRDPSQPIEEVLHARGMEYQIRAKLREEKMKQQSLKSREHSKLNPISEQIVKEKELLYGETTSVRLKKPIGEVKPYVMETIEKPSFKPKINKRSEEIVLNSFGHLYVPPSNSAAGGGNFVSTASPSNVFYADNITPSSKYSKYASESSEFQYDGDDMSISDQSYYYGVDDGVFTLNPSSSNQSVSDDCFSIATSGSVNDPVTAVHLRSAAWVRDKAKRLEKERRERDKEMEKICSFKPKLKENKSFASSIPSNNSSSKPIADRQVEWLKKREERLEVERRKKEEEEIEGYTFKPQLATSSSSMRGQKSTLTKPSSSESIVDPTPKAASSSFRKSDTSASFLDEDFSHVTHVSATDISNAVSHSQIIYPSGHARILQKRDHSDLSMEDRIAMMLNGWDDEEEDSGYKPKIPITKAQFSYSKS